MWAAGGSGSSYTGIGCVSGYTPSGLITDDDCGDGSEVKTSGTSAEGAATSTDSTLLGSISMDSEATGSEKIGVSNCWVVSKTEAGSGVTTKSECKPPGAPHSC